MDALDSGPPAALACPDPPRQLPFPHPALPVDDTPDDLLADARVQSLEDASGQTARHTPHFASLRDSNPGMAWRIVTRMIERAPIELVPDIGSGELECVLNGHADRLIDRIEAAAGASDRFRLALANVWMTKGEFAADIEARLREASGGEIYFVPVDEQRTV